MMLLCVAVAVLGLFGGWAPYAEVEPVVAPVGCEAVEFFAAL